MQPVRIVTRGADPTLPLRMVAAGIGARVGLTLYVISEGRWQPQNFPQAEVETKSILWDRTQNRSNYEPLVQALMTAGEGRTWVTEYAQQAQLYTNHDPRYGLPAPSYAPSRGTPGLADTYFSQCSAARVGTGGTAPSPQPFTPCRSGADAGIETQGTSDAGDARDAGDVDAGDDDAGDADVARDGGDAGGPTTIGTPDAGITPPADVTKCAYLDDLDVAMRGLHASDIWVTRLRASLPVGALTGDLRLEASFVQREVDNVHYATGYTDEQSAGAGTQNACVSAPKQRTAFGSWALAAVSALAAVALLRRRTRR